MAAVPNARALMYIWTLLSLLTINSNGFRTPPPSIKSRVGGGCIHHSHVTTQTWKGSAMSFSAVTTQEEEMLEECPPGYYLDSAKQTCQQLGPLGRASQVVERSILFRKGYKAISNLFGIDRARISSLGVGFALSYSIISNISGSVSLSVAWYMSCKRTGLSPLAPGQWKSLLGCYGAIYGIIQLFRPFRVAAAIAMSKLSGEFLEQTQHKLHCSKGVAIVFQYFLGLIAWGATAALGVMGASGAAGVPVLSFLEGGGGGTLNVMFPFIR